MKAEAYAHLHAFSASFEQAWDAVQKLQPHLDLTRSELKEIYFRLEQARFETLDHLTELANRFEDTAQHRIRKQKASWETQEAERLRKKSEAEKAQWAWQQRETKESDGT
jgi:hypothetical protein